MHCKRKLPTYDAVSTYSEAPLPSISLRLSSVGKLTVNRDAAESGEELGLTYSIYKFAHILGVIFLIGNVSVTSIWKVFADRTHDLAIVAFAQRLVTHTDWTLTGGGIVLTMLGGYGMAWEAHIPLTQTPWLLWSQVLFVISGVVWLFVLIPVQTAQSRQAKAFVAQEPIPTAYRRLSRLWILWGVGATIPLIVALYLMIAKVS